MEYIFYKVGISEYQNPSYEPGPELTSQDDPTREEVMEFLEIQQPNYFENLEALYNNKHVIRVEEIEVGYTYWMLTPLDIAYQVERIQNAKEAIKESINDKGGTLTNELIDDYAGKIDLLPLPKEEQTKIVSPTTSSQDVLPDTNKVLSKVTVNAIPTETKSQQPNLSSNNQTINATSGKFMTSFTITKDTTNHIASNIRNGKTLYGVTGNLQPAKVEQEKTVSNPNFSAGDVVVTPDANKVLSKATVKKDANLVAGNIKDGVTLFGVTGDYEGEGIDVYSMIISEGSNYYKAISKGLYIAYNKDNLFEDAWESSLAVDTSEISAKSDYSSPSGITQYPNGETEGVIIPHSVTSIGDYAFRFWTSNNQPLVIPNSVTSIGNSAFYYWRANNQPLVIPNSVTSIGSSAFQSWDANNQPLVIPNSVTSIGSQAFYEWRANNHPLVISNSVTSIGDMAFSYWEANNQPLVIPKSVTSIGDKAFEYWRSVPYVEIQAITPPTLANYKAFSIQNNAPIYVPDESVEAYKTATNWVNLSYRIFSINDK